MRPRAGSRALGRSSKGISPFQSYPPLQPGMGKVPSPRRRIGTRAGAMKPIVAYRRMAEAFPELFASLEPIRMYGGTIPLAFAPRSYGDNVLLVGDAAGQVKPFSGGGIYTSLVAARHAAISVREAFERDAFGAKSLAAYERRWKREIGRELGRARDAVSVEELERAQSITRSRTYLRMEDTRSVSALYGAQSLLDLPLTTPEETVAKTDAVTVEDVARVARRLIREDALYLAVVGPFEDAAALRDCLTLEG